MRPSAQSPHVDPVDCRSARPVGANPGGSSGPLYRALHPPAPTRPSTSSVVGCGPRRPCGRSAGRGRPPSCARMNACTAATPRAGSGSAGSCHTMSSVIRSVHRPRVVVVPRGQVAGAEGVEVERGRGGGHGPTLRPPVRGSQDRPDPRVVCVGAEGLGLWRAGPVAGHGLRLRKLRLTPCPAPPARGPSLPGRAPSLASRSASVTPSRPQLLRRARAPPLSAGASARPWSASALASHRVRWRFPRARHAAVGRRNPRPPRASGPRRRLPSRGSESAPVDTKTLASRLGQASRGRWRRRPHLPWSGSVLAVDLVEAECQQAGARGLDALLGAESTE